MNKPFIIGGDGVKLLKPKNNIDLKYLYYNLFINNIHPEGYKRHFPILKNKEISIIEDREKQEKIGRLFYNIDSLLNNTENKIKLLKKYKEGLLQKMFV